MSTQPESVSKRSAPMELAPSEMAREESSWPRMFGLMGMSLAVIGAVVVLFNGYYGPRIISKQQGMFAFILGALGMLYHAIRDGNPEVRRAYCSLLGFGLIGVAGIVTVVDRNLFPVYGTACLFGSLCFLLAVGRHEDDPNWRKIIVGVMITLGAVMSVLSIGGAIFIPEFLIGPGLVLGVMGLLFLCGTLNQFDDSSDASRQLALGMAGLGGVAILYALIRSALWQRFGELGFLIPNGLLMICLGVMFLMVAIGVLSEAKIVVLVRRELSAFFYSPVAYMVLFGFAIISGYNHLLWIGGVTEGPVQEPIVAGLFFNLVFVLGVMIAVPAITMRLFSEEKRTGTYEVLMCAPVTEFSVVVSKFFAGLIFFCLLWVPMGVYLIAFRLEVGKPFDYRPLLSLYLAVAISGMSFVGMGLFCSSLTRNQIVAFVLCFVGMMAQLLFFIFPLESMSKYLGSMWGDAIRHASFLHLWLEAIQGKLLVKDLILQSSFGVFWLFLTVRVLEARRWS